MPTERSRSGDDWLEMLNLLRSSRSCVGAHRPHRAALRDRRSTTVVPVVVSHASKLPSTGDAGDGGDAERRIYTQAPSAGAERSLVQIQSPRLN